MIPSNWAFYVFIMDKHDNFAFVKYRLAICHQVCHSAMTAETCAFADGFDAAYMLKHDLEKILQQPMPVQMQRDSKKFVRCHIAVDSDRGAEGHVPPLCGQAGLRAPRDVRLGLFAGDNVISGAFTNIMMPSQLLQAFKTFHINHSIENWVVGVGEPV